MKNVVGTIQEASAKPFDWGTRYAFKIGGNEYSVFSNKILDPDNLAFIQGLKVEDEVSFDWDFEENKKNPNRPFRTIVGATPVQSVDKEKPAAPPASNRVDARADPKPDYKGESDTRIRSMALSYAKDWIIATNSVAIQAGITNFLETKDILTAAKQFEKYIQTGD